MEQSNFTSSGERPAVHLGGESLRNVESPPPIEAKQQDSSPPTSGGANPPSQSAATTYPTLPAPDPSALGKGTPPVADAPLIAGDDELIEKEWVTKAKKIVDETRADPYRQENEMNKLQADYLKKRYGKDIKLAGD